MASVTRSQIRHDPAQDVIREIADRVSALMESRGISQTELASMCGVSQMSISRLCNAKHNPSILMMLAVSRALDTSIDALTTGD